MFNFAEGMVHKTSNTIQGYRVFYDPIICFAFTSDANKTLVHDMFEGSTCSWFDTKEHAEEAAKLYNSRVESGEWRIQKCKDCNTYFVITDKESKWYVAKDMMPPARCKCCRDARKARANKQ